MNKKSFLVLVTLFASSLVYSQDGDAMFHFGLKASPSLAWLHSDTKDLNTSGSKFGFGYGLVLEFSFTKNYAFGTGIEVSYQGGKSKYSSSNILSSSVFEITDKLQYIEIPLTLKLKTNEIGDFTYFLQFGVAPGVCIRAKEDQHITTQVTGGSTTASDSTDINIIKNINNFNLSMVIGGGLEFGLSGNTVILAGLSFSNGLLDVYDDDNVKANSNYVALTVGVLF